LPLVSFLSSSWFDGCILYFCHRICFLTYVRPNSNACCVVIQSKLNVVLFYIGLYFANMCYLRAVYSTYPKSLQLMSKQEFLLQMYIAPVLSITYLNVLSFPYFLCQQQLIILFSYFVGTLVGIFHICIRNTPSQIQQRMKILLLLLYYRHFLLVYRYRQNCKQINLT
jgi:hypothetical protein